MQRPNSEKCIPIAVESYGFMGNCCKIPPIMWVFIVFSICVKLDISVSQAQNSPPLIVPIPHPMTTLLRAKEVRQELGISAAQIRAAEQVIHDVELPLWRLRDLPIQERNDAAGLLIPQLRQNLAQILSQRQIERLSQLARQAEGVAVVLEPEVTSKLGLSVVQIENIRIALNASYNKLFAFQRNTEIRTESRRAAYIRKLNDETEKNIITVLNSHQQRTLKQLMGQPFDLSKVRMIACKAPEFETETWINPTKVPFPDLVGKVTVIHFYAFGCGNCIRTLPYYNQWREHFPPSAFQIIGIHRPETERERDIEKVKEKAVETGIQYPVAIDNESLMWDVWANRIWPSIYLIDKSGFVRYWWYGELNWQGAESEKYLRGKIKELLEESVIESTASTG